MLRCVEAIGDVCIIKDLRRNNYYLTELEKKEWDERNILYNTLWFYLNKGIINSIPDVEYSDAAIESYKKIKCFSSWNTISHSPAGKVLVSNKGEILNADLMTGWWNPTKYYLGWDKRSDITEELLKEIPKEKCESEVIKWIKEKTSNSAESAIAFLNFLKVVYTEGNIIPAPINWKGRGIDSWADKLEKIIEPEPKLEMAKKWNQYIKSYFGERKIFIKKNLLEMYIQNENVISPWGENEPDSWTKATDAQWKNFFENVRKSIVNRNESINKIK